MIKVVQKEIFRCTCHQCKTALEYEYSDTVEKRSRDYLGDVDIYRAIKCPVCSYDIALNIS